MNLRTHPKTYFPGEDRQAWSEKSVFRGGVTVVTPTRISDFAAHEWWSADENEVSG